MFRIAFRSVYQSRLQLARETNVWLKDEAPEDSVNLPAPEIIAADITENLEAALAQFAEIAADLKK